MSKQVGMSRINCVHTGYNCGKVTYLIGERILIAENYRKT